MTAITTDSFQVNSFVDDPNTYSFSPVSELQNNIYMVAWFDNFNEKFIYIRVFSGNWIEKIPETQINTKEDYRAIIGGISTNKENIGLVVWDNGNNGVGNIHGRYYNASGYAQDKQFQINTVTTNTQILARVTLLPTNRYIVTWMSDAESAGNFRVMGRIINPNALIINGTLTNITAPPPPPPPPPNLSPVLLNPIDDQVAKLLVPYEFSFDANVFLEPEEFGSP